MDRLWIRVSDIRTLLLGDSARNRLRGLTTGTGDSHRPPASNTAIAAAFDHRIAAYPGCVSDDMGRTARIEDVHKLAIAMPYVTVENMTSDHPVYQVGGKSFVFFRNPRRDAIDPHTGERYRDVIVFWVGTESDKLALVQDRRSPFFTTPHFDGHPSVLLRASRIDELTQKELAEIVQDAWLSRASARRAASWLSAHPSP